MSWETFFSTLASATAAIIGFVFAISTVVYQTERRRREKVTEELQQEFLDLKNEYLHQFNDISTILQRDLERSEDAVTNDLGYLKDLETTKNIHNVGLEKTIEIIKEDENANFPHIRTVKCYFTSLVGHLSEIRPSGDHGSHNMLDYNTIEEVENDIGDIDEFLSFLGEYREDFLDEVRSIHGNQEDIVFRPLYVDLFEDDNLNSSPTKRLRDWIDKNEQSTSLISNSANGYNIVTLDDILSKFRSDFHDLAIRADGSTLNYTPGIIRFFKHAIVMLFFGVILPISFLATPSIDYHPPNELITGIAFICLMCVSVSIAHFLYSVSQDLR